MLPKQEGKAEESKRERNMGEKIVFFWLVGKIISRERNLFNFTF